MADLNQNNSGNYLHNFEQWHSTSSNSRQEVWPQGHDFRSDLAQLCRALNYGALGGFLGHEISHVFDTRGKTFDESGNVRPSWWSRSAVEEHERRSSCFAQQYSKIIQAKNLTAKINGNLTLDENIADSEGLKVAFKALRTIKKRLPLEKRVPGLPFTQEQLFFLAFARAKCALYSKYAFTKVLEDVHAPDVLRVYATLRNSPEFSAAWKCPRGSFMNPEEKCQLWS